MLSVNNIKKQLGIFSILDISFEVSAGEYFVLLGSTGAGKTVLLETLAGMIQPDSGQIFLDGRNITSERIQSRRIGLVYQDRALFPHLTVYDNIGYGLRSRGLKRPLVHNRVTRVAEDLGIDHLLNRKPGTLSGGESQRTALARTLVTEPRCLLLDEPLSSLDVQFRGEIRALLRKINREGQTTIHVTHDYEEAVSLASRIAIIEEGQIVQVGRPEEVFRNPRSKFAAQFVGIRNVYKGTLRFPVGGERGVGEFITAGNVFSILTDSPDGPGHFMLRSEDVTVSNAPSATSARNTFEGTITDIAPARFGVEVVVNIGVNIAALITSGSQDALGLRCGKKVWVSFKATAGRFVRE